jgi:hypothetical protein
MLLKQSAGWNQTEADWLRFIALEPEGCFVAEFDSTPAGTVTTCIFGHVAWVAMVLVDPKRRGRGIGKSLLCHALAFLHGRGVRTIRLDASPQGQPLYETLGFAEEYRLTRYEGVLGPSSESPHVEEVPPGQWSGLLRLDRSATGTDRGKFLQRLYADQPAEVRAIGSGGNIQGYLAGRRGSRALQIGPCVADPDSGPLLLADAFHRHSGQRVCLDIPAPNPGPRPLAQAYGLSPQRPFTRMCRGPRVLENPSRIWASSGPEMG